MKPTLLVMAAGLGSRYGGVKQIDALGAHGETLLDYSTYDAVKSGFGRVVYIIRPDIESDFRERLFDRVARNIDASYVFQTHDSLLTPAQAEASKNRTKPWGTTHAVLCARDVVKEPFAVINADDFYGRGAYEILSGYLSTLDVTSTEYAMVGYRLRNTMSDKGSVSRGVCKVSREGYLTSIKENTKIEFARGAEVVPGDEKDADARKIVSHLEGGDVYLSGDEVVSMNFFGFAPSFFDYLQDYFDRFISINAGEMKAECLLPAAVGESIANGSSTMRVFSTSEKWFGMTYKEDRETVVRNLAEKTASLVYPVKLWEK